MEVILHMRKTLCAYLNILQITFFTILPHISALLTILSSADLTQEERLEYIYQLELQQKQLFILWSHK